MSNIIIGDLVRIFDGSKYHGYIGRVEDITPDGYIHIRITEFDTNGQMEITQLAIKLDGCEEVV